MYSIGKELKEFVESGVATVVGTGDRQGRPQVMFAWAARVLDESTVEVFLDTERAGKTLSNLRDNGRIAMTMAYPASYRSVQLKGRLKETGEADDRDRDWVEARREAFLTATSLIGDPPETIRSLWLDDVVSVKFTVEQAFDQTPGPEAGKPL